MKLKEQLNELRISYYKLENNNSLEDLFQIELYKRELKRLEKEVYYSWSYRDKNGELIETSLYYLNLDHLINIAILCFRLDWEDRFRASIRVIAEKLKLPSSFIEDSFNLYKNTFFILDETSRKTIFKNYLIWNNLI